MLGKLPQTVIADADYGSEENYAWLLVLPFYQRAIFFCGFKEICRKFFCSKQRRGRTDCGKAIAFALVSGFSPLRGMKKIWRAQRLEQLSVRGASTQNAYVNPTLKNEGCPSSHFMAFGTAPSFT